MERSANWRAYLGDKDFYRNIAKIAIPISLQQLITVGINLMDTIMLSSMGDAQLSASSLAGQFVNLFQICCMGIGMGASVLTARFWGMEDLPALRKAVTIMLRFCAAFSAVFMIITAVAPQWIMLLYTKDSELIYYGDIYLRYMIPTYLCMSLSLTCTIVLRSVGEARLPLIASILAFFVNVFFNWVFIFGMLGAPRMEIAGAALGTLIARIFELVFICGYFFLVDKKIAYRFYHLRMKCRDLMGEYFRISIPVLISDSLLALGNNAVAMVMGHIGKAFVAANSVTTVVQQLSSVLTQGVANASGILTGHTMGRGDYEKAQKQGYTFLGPWFCDRPLCRGRHPAAQGRRHQLLSGFTGSPRDRAGTDARHQLHCDLSGDELHSDQRRAPSGRRHQIPDGRRYSFSVGCLYPARRSGRSGTELAAVLDLYAS